MILKLDTPQLVNKAQYLFAKKWFKGLLAHRIDEAGKFFIKPLCFLGKKKIMEQAFSRLETKN